jgi:hypothetical protein
MTEHDIHKSVDVTGWRASCGPCGWGVRRDTRSLRDQDADAHELVNGVDQSPTERTTP